VTSTCGPFNCFGRLDRRDRRSMRDVRKESGGTGRRSLPLKAQSRLAQSRQISRAGLSLPAGVRFSMLGSREAAVASSAPLIYCGPRSGPRTISDRPELCGAEQRRQDVTLPSLRLFREAPDRLEGRAQASVPQQGWSSRRSSGGRRTMSSVQPPLLPRRHLDKTAPCASSDEDWPRERYGDRGDLHGHRSLGSQPVEPE
jgi:hypothetical protein